MEFFFDDRTKIKSNNCVYIIKNKINNKIYIGSTINLKKRIIDHYNLLMNNKHSNKKLQNSWNKNGKENFIYEIIEENIPIIELINKEQFYIVKYDSVKNGFNILPNAGTTLGNKWSKQAKTNYSKLKKLLNLGEIVIQYDLNGNVINEYPNMKIASELMGLKNPSNIGMCCRKERNTVGGFKWEYKDKEKQKKYGFHTFTEQKEKCPHCDSSNTKKSGFNKWNGNKKQVFKCNDCDKRFNETTNVLHIWGKNIERNKKIVELFKVNGYNILDISKIINVSELTVKRVLKKYNINAKI